MNRELTTAAASLARAVATYNQAERNYENAAEVMATRETQRYDAEKNMRIARQRLLEVAMKVEVAMKDETQPKQNECRDCDDPVMQALAIHQGTC